ncbi:SDR family oxidoreductase [Pseudomonas sp. SWRI18]|uniref:SDR family NAD(P)-dependent oxidoreductase n=1 Tax=Pseudomonas sp. SWRI18 TaxID=2753888 RepID=UPI001647E60E|nr:SDR family oxidoreductase [Pseudomonas sp. SWRI18]MBC3304639.1 SDR family oxidoreductase [Pseudomonas sp. SWRI18]
MAQQLQGKVALVTGGSRGIGAAIAKRLAADGAHVAFSYAKSLEQAQAVAADIERHGVQALAVQADQGDTAQVTALVKRVHQHFGRLDILINSAGVFVTGHVADPDADIAAFDRQQAVNVGGVVSAVRAAVSLMNDGGRIISVGTTGADHVPFPGAADYVATKAAVAAYSRGWARDLGPRNITVNVIQPGAINTEMNPENADHAPFLAGQTALGRYGQPQDIAAAVSFLAGPEASYITGATLNVDGGQSA